MIERAVETALKAIQDCLIIKGKYPIVLWVSYEMVDSIVKELSVSRAYDGVYPQTKDLVINGVPVKGLMELSKDNWICEA